MLGVIFCSPFIADLRDGVGAAHDGDQRASATTVSIVVGWSATSSPFLTSPGWGHSNGSFVTVILLGRRGCLRPSMIGDRGGLQALMRGEQGGNRAQCLERERRDRGEPELTRRRFGHPSRDREIDAVRSTDRDRDLRMARCANHREFRTCQWMEWVVDPDARRLGIVERCW